MMTKRLAPRRALGLRIQADPEGAGHAPEALTIERPLKEIVTHG
jgi:hypothetical protein